MFRADIGRGHGETSLWSFEVMLAVLQKAPGAVSLSDAVQFSAAARQQLTAGQPDTSDQSYLYVCEVVLQCRCSFYTSSVLHSFL